MADRRAPAGKRKKRGARRGSNPVQRTAQLARRRERRTRSLRLLAFGTVILAIGLLAGYQFWLRDSSVVSIKDLEIVGITGKDEESKQIRGTIEVAVGEMTTLHAKPDLLADELSRFPRVADSRIETSLPDSATVTVTLRADGSRFGSGADELLIATDGVVLGPAGDRADGLPRIVSGDPPESGRLSGRSLSQALVLGGVPKELRPYVRSSDYGQEGVEVTLSNGLVLIFGDANQTEEKWKSAASVIADPEMTDASYVDLTVPRRPAVRGADEVTEDENPLDEPVEEPVAGE